MKMLLTLTFLALVAHNVHAFRECSVEPAKRTDCGYPGIGKANCESKGCCFDNRISGVIWCFYKNNKQTLATLATCEVEEEKRVDCGYPGITQCRCESKGCCFNNSKPDVIWCFYKGF